MALGWFASYTRVTKKDKNFFKLHRPHELDGQLGAGPASSLEPVSGARALDRVERVVHL